MWLFLWVIFVLGAIGFFLWSYHATFEQKRIWKKFAEKYNLNYVPGQMLESPAMNGTIKDHNINFYPQLTENEVGQRSVKNVIELFLNNVPDLICVIASNGFSDFVTQLDLPESFDVNHPQWPKDIMARTFDNEAPELWFQKDDKRVEALNKLMKLPFDTAFVADGEQCFIAIRTTNPLSNQQHLNKLMKTMFETVQVLEGDQSADNIEKPKGSKTTDDVPALNDDSNS